VRGKKGGGAQILGEKAILNEISRVEETRINRAFFQALKYKYRKKNGEFLRGCNVFENVTFRENQSIF